MGSDCLYRDGEKYLAVEGSARLGIGAAIFIAPLRNEGSCGGEPRWKHGVESGGFGIDLSPILKVMNCS